MSLQGFSALSLTSRETYGIEEDPNYEDMTDEELKEHLEHALRTNEILTMENDVFERYLNRNDSQLLAPMTQVLETAKKISSQITRISSPHFRVFDSMSGFNIRGQNTPLSPVSSGSIQTFTGSRGGHISMIQPSTRGLRIALLQRIEMTNKEIEEMKMELKTSNRKMIKKRAHLRAQIEEIEMRIRDTDKARCDLEENIVKKGTDSLTGKIPAEKFIRYIELWVKDADRIIDKFRLKSSTIKSQIRKTRMRLRQREELSESIHLIDFQALAIENKEYSQQIEEKTKQLMELKKMTGQYRFTLSTHRDKLQKQQTILKNIKKQINIKENQIQKLNKDLNYTENQLQKIEQRVKEIPIRNQEVPDINEIINIQNELEEMKKTYARLERHIKIKLPELLTLTKKKKTSNN